MQWHYMVWEKKLHSQVTQLPAGFPRLCSLDSYSNFSFPLLLSFYLADRSCPAFHRKDSICGPLHQLLCLPLHTRWKALMARTDSCVAPRHSGLWFWVGFQHPCDKHNTYLILPHTSASGTTDMKKFVFPMQNWSSRLKFELFRNMAASFPTQKPIILSENSCTPR